LKIETAKCIIETALLTSQNPISISDIKKIFDGELDEKILNSLLIELKDDWKDRGLDLVSVSTGWRFQSKLEFAKYLDKLQPEKNFRYSRAVMETIAIIAYKQPVTRGDIEKVRGVSVSSYIMKTLEERQWIISVGQKETIGKPTMFGTTKKFLDDLGLLSIEDLPVISDSDFKTNEDLMRTEEDNL
tara:strand:- start:974 stop:1534 length:561 start_codon:yes stop_codon:yes gene_type:complete